MNRKKNDKMRMKKRKDKNENEKEKDCWIRQRMSQDVTVFSNDRSKRRIRQQLIHLEKVTCLQGQLLHQHKNFFSLLLLKRHFRETMFQAHLIREFIFRSFLGPRSVRANGRKGCNTRAEFFQTRLGCLIVHNFLCVTANGQFLSRKEQPYLMLALTLPAFQYRIFYL